MTPRCPLTCHNISPKLEYPPGNVSGFFSFLVWGPAGTSTQSGAIAGILLDSYHFIGPRTIWNMDSLLDISRPKQLVDGNAYACIYAMDMSVA